MHLKYSSIRLILIHDILYLIYIKHACSIYSHLYEYVDFLTWTISDVFELCELLEDKWLIFRYYSMVDFLIYRR